MRFLHFRHSPQLQDLGRPPDLWTRAAFIARAASLTADLDLRFKCDFLEQSVLLLACGFSVRQVKHRLVKVRFF